MMPKTSSRAIARTVVSTDSCIHPGNAIRLAPILAGAFSKEFAA